MAKEVIQVMGVVTECLPNANFRVRLDDENCPLDHVVLCHLAGKMKVHFIRIIPGDVVTVEITPYDMNKGRIVYRHKKTKKLDGFDSEDIQAVKAEEEPEPEMSDESIEKED